MTRESTKSPRGSVLYARAFFDLQLHFARTVALLSGVPFARAVLEYTNLYIRLGFGRDFDPGHPGWRAYLVGLRRARDPGAFTHRVHATRTEAVAPPAVVAARGCFSYARLGQDRIRLHFQNAEPDGLSPLRSERQGQRRAELAALFAHVGRTVGQPVRVAGASWLYNLSAYRRLFPPSYLATARVLEDRYQHMPLWGQFVDRRGELRESQALQLRGRLALQASLTGLNHCFPLQVLALEAPVRDFYDFYGVSHAG